MALPCFKFNRFNPFGAHFRVYNVSVPEVNGTGAESGAEKNREAIQSRIEASDLLPPTVQKLNEALAKAPEEELDLWLQNIEQAMEDLKILDDLLEKAAESAPMQRALQAVFQERNRILEQLHLTLDDVRALQRLQEMAGDRIDLMEAHLIQDSSKVDELKANPLPFVRRADTHLSLNSDRLEEEVAYLFDFTNPITGKINTFAQRNITLADTMKALGVKSLNFKKKGSRESKTVYLWPNRGANGEVHSVPDDGTHTASTSTYVAVLEGDSFMLNKGELHRAEPEPTPEPTLTLREEPHGNLFDLENPVDGPSTGIPRGASARRGMTWDQQMDEYGAPPSSVDLVVNEVETSHDYSDLKGRKVTLPADLKRTLRKENPWEEIRNLKFKDQGGDRVYTAVNYLAERRTKDGIRTDNKTMWEDLFGFGFGKNDMTFDTIVRASYDINIGDKRYNKPGEWLLKQYETSTGPAKKEYGQVLEAAQTLLNTVPNLKDSGVTAESYEEMLEAGLPAEMKEASSYTDSYLFDKESDMPYVKLGLIKLIGFGLSPDKRPRITEDNWLDTPSKIRSAEERRLDEGEVRIVSQAEAYDNLMEMGNTEDYVEEVNRIMDLGAGQVAALEGTTTTPAHITVADVKANKEPTDAQKKAIHYGMALEAAQKLGYYQAAEDKLTPAEREERSRQGAVGNVYGTAFAGAGIDVPAMDHVGANGGVAANLNVAPGLTVDAGLTGGVTDAGEQLVGDADVRFGAKWRSKRLGKNGRWRVGAGVHASVGIAPGEDLGDVGVDANAYAMYDLTKDGVWAAKLGVGAGVGVTEGGASAEAELGLERDFERQFQVFLSEYKEKNAAEIATYKRKAHEAIDASSYDSVSKERLKAASDAVIDKHVEEEALKAWTKGFHQFKLAGFGVAAGANLSAGLDEIFKNGLRIGPYVTIAFGFSSTTLYVETPTAVGGGAAGALSEYAPADTSVVPLEFPVSELYIGGAAEREAAIARASEKLSAARDARNAALEGTMSLNDNDDEIPYDQVDFANLNGHVKLYVGGNVQAITDGGTNFLNAALDGDLSVFVDQTGNSTSSANEYEIYISDVPGATRESIRAESGDTHLAWIQTLDGRISNSRIVNAGTGTDSYYRLNEAVGNLAPANKPAESYVDEVSYEDLLRQTEARDASLFDEYSREDFEIAATVGSRLIESGFQYDDLALGNRDQEIRAAIEEIYKQVYAEKGIPLPEINIDRIYMARQHAMEVGRPENLEVPIAWNTDAAINLSPTGGALYMEYISKNKESIENNGLRGQLPTGSEFYISVSHQGVARGEALLLGYYDARLHGEILGKVQWKEDKPGENVNADAVLQAMGEPITDENRQAVHDMFDAIKNQTWPDSPFNKLEGTPTFEKAKYTMAGELLLTNAIELYGPVKGEKLRKMANGEIALDATLESEFLSDVTELMTNHQTMVGETPVIMEMELYSGLYEKCYNLVISRNFRLNYQTPKTKSPKVTVEHREREAGLREEEGFTYKQTEITLGVPTLEEKQAKSKQDEEGDGLQDEGGDEGDQAAGEEEESSGPGDHPTI